MDTVKERLEGFSVEELIDLLEIGEEDILDRFEDRLTEAYVPFLFEDGY